MATKRKIANLGIGLLLVSGAVLRTYWSFGGPEWSYWLGNLAFGIFFIVPGVMLLLIPKFAIIWMNSFAGSARGLKLTNWSQMGALQKIVLYALAFMELLIGLVILVTNMYRLINGCPPDGDCPGY